MDMRKEQIEGLRAVASANESQRQYAAENDINARQLRLRQKPFMLVRVSHKLCRTNTPPLPFQNCFHSWCLIYFTFSDGTGGGWTGANLRKP